MKCGRVILLVLTAIIVQAPPAYAGPIIIDIVSESYRVWGCTVPWPPPSYCSDISSSEPVHSALGYAGTRVSDSQVVVEAGVAYAQMSQSRAEFVFRPRASGFAETSVDAGRSSGMVQYSMDLQDITTGDWLLQVRSSDCWWTLSCSESHSLWFVDGHEYRVGVYVSQDSDDRGGVRVTMPFTTAPDPGSTLLLLGIGLAGLRAWRRRRE